MYITLSLLWTDIPSHKLSTYIAYFITWNYPTIYIHTYTITVWDNIPHTIFRYPNDPTYPTGYIPWNQTASSRARRVFSRFDYWRWRWLCVCVCYFIGCLLRFRPPQAILSAIWGRQGAELMAWGCLLEGDSFVGVMSSDVHRLAWVRVGLVVCFRFSRVALPFFLRTYR